MNIKKIAFCLSLLAFVFSLRAQILKVSFENVRNQNGVFRVGFFTSEQSYDEGNPVFYKTVPKNTVINGVLTYVFNDIPPGTYGIVVLDDENANDKTDYSWFMPSEGFGFSNYIINKIKIPEFDDFDFTYSTDCLVKIIFRYL